MFTINGALVPVILLNPILEPVTTRTLLSTQTGKEAINQFPEEGDRQFIPKTGGRGNRDLIQKNPVHVQHQGRGRGHFRGRGDFSGKGHFSGGGRGYNTFVSEKGGYYNSLYRNSNVNY